MYAVFDLLYLDGHSLLDRPYEERRERLESAPAERLGLARPGRPPAESGSKLLELTREQSLEGVVAKRLGSRYEPGRRGRALTGSRSRTRFAGSW